MMAPTSWQPSDGERLKFLRNASGLDLYKFAYINAISAAQLKLLEDGGDSSLFYSPAIKTGVGRKLLRRLGDKDASGVPEQAPQTAIGPADVLTKSSVAAADSPTRRSSYVLSLLVVAALLLIGNANFDESLQWVASVLQPPTRQGSAQAEVKRIETSQAAVTPLAESATDASQIDASVATLEPNSIEPAAEPTPRLESVAVQEPRSECRWSDQEIELRPAAVRTEGNYVHFVASDDVQICVLDGQMKTSVLSLKAGDAKSVRGAAPWHIYSRNMSDLKVFFRGYHVPVPDSKITQISLREW